MCFESFQPYGESYQQLLKFREIFFYNKAREIIFANT